MFRQVPIPSEKSDGPQYSNLNRLLKCRIWGFGIPHDIRKTRYGKQTQNLCQLDNCIFKPLPLPVYRALTRTQHGRAPQERNHITKVNVRVIHLCIPGMPAQTQLQPSILKAGKSEGTRRIMNRPGKRTLWEKEVVRLINISLWYHFVAVITFMHLDFCTWIFFI